MLPPLSAKSNVVTHSSQPSESTASAAAESATITAQKNAKKPSSELSSDTAISQVQRPSAITGETRDPRVIEKLGAAFERYMSSQDMDCGTQGPSKLLWWQNLNEKGLQKLAAMKSDILVRVQYV